MANDDVYTHGHQPAVVAQHRRRTAATCAAYLLPHLGETDSVLDVGCGPGSITVGLAGVVHDGMVVGIDAAADVVAAAVTLTTECGITNVTFEVGDVYHLDAADDSYDVAHAHQVLQHLSRPVDALVEMQRVVRPGGLIAVRDADYGTFVHSPHDPLLDDWLAMYHAVAYANNAEPDAGRHLLEWCHLAGLLDVELATDTWSFTEPDERTNWGASWADRTLTSSLGEQAVAYGIATRADLEEMAQAWRSWADHPDAVYYFVHVAALARV